MTSLSILIIVCFAISTCNSLSCYECANARTNAECLATGSLNFCTEDDAICEDQVRHSRDGRSMIIEKRCKQAWACRNNVIQNRRPATPIQCFLRSRNSVCRCCCTTDGCNRDLLTCWGGFQNELPMNNPICPIFPEVPENANMQCTGNKEVGTQCTFECHQGYYMTGEKVLTCLSNGEYDFPPPNCNPKTCSPETFTLGNGSVSCSNGNFLGSRCSFQCNEDYRLIGASDTDCIDTRNPRKGIWTAGPSFCQPLICPPQGPIPNGRFTCTDGNRFGSVCRWRCNGNYELFPSDEFSVNTCLVNNQWDKPFPCCTLPCLPFAVVDLMVVLDSSSSVGASNWNRTKMFVRSLFDRFALAPDAAQFSAFRYNRDVDTATAIYFNDFPRNKDAFLQAFDEIPYDGSGTNTGRALTFARTTAFRRGNRRRAPDILILITDGNAIDSVTIPAFSLRSDNVEIRVIPVRPPNNANINLQQMVDIAGSRENVIEVALQRGFEALDENFAEQLAQNLCPPPCTNPFHQNPLERVTPARLQQYVV